MLTTETKTLPDINTALTAPQIARLIGVCQWLESGTLPQAKSHLRMDQAGCCLGWMCEYASQEGGPVARWQAHPSRHVDTPTYTYGTGWGEPEEGEDYTSYLPPDVAAWYGFNAVDPCLFVVTIPDDDIQIGTIIEPAPWVPDEPILPSVVKISLSDLNDAGCPFPVIAALLRSQIIRPAIERWQARQAS